MSDELFHACALCGGTGYRPSGSMLDHPERRSSDRHVADLVMALGRGARNVRSSYDIAGDIDVAQRAVGFIANAARRRGYLIGSVHGEGYYLIETEDELRETMRHIQSRVGGIAQTLHALDEAWAAR